MAYIGTGVEYGLHCLLWLVEQPPGPPSSRDLAALQGFSPSFVAKILPKLEKAGILTASEGLRGGYRLARPADQVSVLDVVDAIEGQKPLFDCQEVRERCVLFGSEPPAWATGGVCSIHAVMLRAERFGPRIASTMAAGGVLAYLVLIPMIHFFGANVAGVIPPGHAPIAGMSPDDIRGSYVLYIGAGAVATGGIISLFRSLPMIVGSLRGGIADWRAGRAANSEVRVVERTDQDLSPRVVGIGLIGLMAAILLSRSLHMNPLGAVLIVVFGFLFVTVSSRLTGEIGSSSNPISGMTVATLLLTCLAFLAIGWTGSTYYVTALSVGGIVCVAASNGGTTSQDLKTGFLLGATPRSQQIAILAGALASALVLGPILLSLNDAATVYVPQTTSGWTAPATALTAAPTVHLKGPQAKADGGAYRVFHKTDEVGGASGQYLVDASGRPAYLVDPGINGTHKTRPDGTTVNKFAAPKATLMSYIIKGILSRQLPWTLVILGGMIAGVLEMCGIPSLAFAVGVYLPLSSSSPIFFGGVVRWLVDRHLRHRHREANLTEAEMIAETDKSPGVLVASGYIAGGAIAGIGIAFMAGALTGFNQKVTDWMTAHNPFYDGPWADALALIPFLGLIVGLYVVGRRATSSEFPGDGGLINH